MAAKVDAWSAANAAAADDERLWWWAADLAELGGDVDVLLDRERFPTS